MKNIEILIVSDSTRENLVAEIWVDENLLCEVTNEGKLEITFYDSKNIRFDYFEFIDLVEKARHKLIG